MRSRKRSPGRNLSIIRFIGGSDGGGSLAEVSFVSIRGFETGKGAVGGGGSAVALRSAESRFTILSRGVSSCTGDSGFVTVSASDHVSSSRLIQDLSDDTPWLYVKFLETGSSGFPACSSWSGGDGALTVWGRA